MQAWSNNRYKSVEHKVVANATSERFSAAYFLCPSYDSPVGTCGEPSPYRSFTFGEYRRMVQEDVKRTGRKITMESKSINYHFVYSFVLMCHCIYRRKREKT
jgi:gibberellin 2-oxidase